MLLIKLAEGKGAVVTSGYVGNWEILGQAIAAAGYSIASPFYDPRVTPWRSQRGLQIIWRGDNSGKVTLQAPRNIGLMGFWIDRSRHQGCRGSCRSSAGRPSRRHTDSPGPADRRPGGLRLAPSSGEALQHYCRTHQSDSDRVDRGATAHRYADGSIGVDYLYGAQTVGVESPMMETNFGGGPH